MFRFICLISNTYFVRSALLSLNCPFLTGMKIVACARGNAVTMKNMLETAFPGINVMLANHPPPLPKRLLSKVVPVFQFGIIGMMMAGEQIFPRLGMMPPPWYYSMRANRFGSIASAWLVGNFIQSFLQSSGAFEVYCNGELVKSLWFIAHADFYLRKQPL